MKHRTYLALALPLTVSTITTPLLGAVDTAVVGWLPDPSYIGGVAIGTIIFNTMYWLFGFLRVSTSGFTAQARGGGDPLEEKSVFLRSFGLALVIGALFILLQWPIVKLAFAIINPDEAVRSLASDYFGIRIWGAPFALMNYVIIGWLMGMSFIKATLLLQLWMNATNIVLDILFVKVFSFGVPGVAAATLTAEISAFIIGLFMIRKFSGISFQDVKGAGLIKGAPLLKMLAVNRDLMIRTICLLTVFNLFTAKGASFGTEVLAANAILLQIHYIMAYFFDGFANASSILTGKAVGSQDERLFRRTVLLSCQWAGTMALLLTVGYYVFSETIIGLFTNLPEVAQLAEQYSLWILFFPASAAFGLVLYGAFTGASEVAPVRNSIMLALVVYLVVQFVFIPHLQNHGLWLAFISFTIGRSVFLAAYVPSLGRKLFPADRRTAASN
ncbi:MATE family efflux transporter [Domibacillus indicus]|uniref:MATE family efflux transporter n=1 Tax=Domibacillus indicus TaxID=1437523 RepID=UPI0006182AFE|nr:MATE family efflux transporter [Domibacillus indicus]